jgi:hypothetical protein
MPAASRGSRLSRRTANSMGLRSRGSVDAGVEGYLPAYGTMGGPEGVLLVGPLTVNARRMSSGARAPQAV